MKGPSVYLHAIEALSPPVSFSQTDFSEIQKRLVKNLKLLRIIDSLYQDSGVDRRHSVVIDPGEEITSRFYSLHRGAIPYEPSTKERNARFTEASALLAVEAAGRALRGTSFKASEITHLVTVSCTGFSNPGMDLAVMDKLNLSPQTERYHIGFMGCYGAFPALRMAQQFCLARPEAVVLVVCVELCTLHFQFKEDLDTILANSLFADGAGAAVVSAKPPDPHKPNYEMLGFMSDLIPDGLPDMAWTIGDNGFDMVLSKYVPRIIGQNIRKPVEESLKKHDLTLSDISAWAIHPGGKSILDKFQKALELGDSQLDVSRRILSRFGNMSAATILFVLKDILDDPARIKSETVFSAAFGPGLAVETALLVRHPPQSQ